jgi:hypothetical protein
MFKTLTPLLSIVTAVVVFFFFTKPMYEKVRVLQDDKAQYERAVQTAADSNRLLQELLQKRNSFSAQELERLEKLVPDSIDRVRLLVDLEAMSRNHRMLFGNVLVEESSVEGEDLVSVEGGGEVTYEEDFVSSDVSFGLIGTYENFRAFLKDLERSLVLAEVVGLEFSALDGDLQQYDMIVRSYALTEATLEK